MTGILKGTARNMNDKNDSSSEKEDDDDDKSDSV
jgi:hypothetical protein